MVAQFVIQGNLFSEQLKITNPFLILGLKTW